MKKILALFILSVCFGLSGRTFAQASDEAIIASAVETLRKGMVDADRSALDKIASARLTYGHSSGKMEDKAEFIEALVSGKSDFTRIDVTDQKIIVSGNTAIVRHVLKGETINNGITTALNIGVMLVWQKEGKEWRLLGRQAFKL